MHALVLLCINQHTKCDVPGLTNYEGRACDWDKFKKTGHVTTVTLTMHAPFRSGLSP